MTNEIAELHLPDVSNMAVFEKWYSQTGQEGIRPNACVLFIFRYRFALSLGGLCRLLSQGFMQWYMYKAVIVFSLIVFWASNTLVVLATFRQAKLKWKARIMGFNKTCIHQYRPFDFDKPFWSSSCFSQNTDVISWCANMIKMIPFSNEIHKFKLQNVGPGFQVMVSLTDMDASVRGTRLQTL